MKNREEFMMSIRYLSILFLSLTLSLAGCGSSSSPGIVASQDAGGTEQVTEDSLATDEDSDADSAQNDSSEGTLTDSINTLSLPSLTETDCVWDEKGKLISETTHDSDGNPALNARGFYQAEYAYDQYGNIVKEEYYNTKKKLVNTVYGYARAEYTFYTDSNNKSHILTEDRYTADGARADLPGSYSYRRDVWDGDQILSSSFFGADGKLTRPTGGYAQILYDVKDKGKTFTVTKKYLDTDGSPLTGRNI